MRASRLAKSFLSPASRVTTSPFQAARFGFASTRAFSIKVGSPIPNIDLDKGFPPKKINLTEFTKGKKVVLVGLPGAFTPT
jgi:hypothetical protein